MFRLNCGLLVCASDCAFERGKRREKREVSNRVRAGLARRTKRGGETMSFRKIDFKTVELSLTFEHLEVLERGAAIMREAQMQAQTRLLELLDKTEDEIKKAAIQKEFDLCFSYWDSACELCALLSDKMEKWEAVKQ